MKTELLQFLEASATEYLATSQLAAMLSSAGATRLHESAAWTLEPGGFYFVVRDDSALIAFRLPSADKEAGGFSIAGAHTDSPHFKIKFNSARQEDLLWTYGLEAYGSPINATWLDRDLCVAGRLYIEGVGGPEPRDFRTGTAVGLIPNPAIHLERQLNKGFEYNVQEHLKFVVSGKESGAGHAPGLADDPLIAVIRDAAGLAGDKKVLAIEAGLYPAELPVLSGAESWLFHSARIDNLAGCFAVAKAIYSSDAASAKASRIQVAAFFNNEEIGSRTWQGAGSRFLDRTLERILAAIGKDGTEAAARMYSGSAFVSVDASHAFHPSFASKYDPAYKNPLGKGPVLKQSAAWKYSGNLELEAWFRAAADREKVQLQTFRNRSDAQGGSTIGPIVSAGSDIRSIDIGIPILSMHSARETAAFSDLEGLEILLREFYEGWGARQ